MHGAVLARKMVLQFAAGDIGQLTDLERRPTVSVMQNRLASAGLLGLRERSVQVSGQQPPRVSA
jgi:hypothetical protein